MSVFASTARKVRNIWSHGEDDEYGQDEHDAQDTSDDSSYRDSKYSASSYEPSYSKDPSYNSSSYNGPSYGGGSGSTGGSAARRLRPVAMPLRAREKNIYTLKPKTQDEAAIAADYMKSGSAVVLNLESVDHVNAVRIIDFMSGVCYGLDGQGHAMKLGDAIFLFTPAEFEISSDEIDYGENREFFFKDVQVDAAAPALQSAGGASMHASPAPSHNPTPSTYQSNERRSWER
jgi:cell division inhibitor SepF